MPKKIKFDVFLEEYDNISKLPAESQALFSQARIACKSAYSIYSGFSVGAAVLLANGDIVLGSNQENASFPNGQCAERVAMFASASKYPTIPFRKLAVVATCQNSASPRQVTPCGACRQTIMEYQVLQQSPIEILMQGPEGKVLVASSADILLPFKFSAKHMDNSI